MGDIIRSQHLHASFPIQMVKKKKKKERKKGNSVQCSSWLGPLFFSIFCYKNTALLLVRVFHPLASNSNEENQSLNPPVWKTEFGFFLLFLFIECSPVLLYHCRCLVCDPLPVQPTLHFNRELNLFGPWMCIRNKKPRGFHVEPVWYLFHPIHQPSGWTNRKPVTSSSFVQLSVSMRVSVCLIERRRRKKLRGCEMLPSRIRRP